MKKTLLILALLLSAFTFGQTNGITYQAVIYNANGESVPGINNPNAPLVNKEICMQFSIVDDYTKTEYQEKITVTTDAFGMVNLVIGNGTQTGGYASSFGTIVWSSTKKYLKVGLDQSGTCSSFEEISNQVLSYVPFALAANSATSISGIVGIANGGTNASTIIGAKTNLQLQNVDNTRDLDKPITTSTQLVLDTKVDKVVGKNLSTEDFTTAEKTKLASLGGTQDLSLLAPLLSPTFTGTPIAPTASSSNNTTQIATTAFVNNAVTNKFVDLTTNQTIAGNKTFSSDLKVNGLTVGKGKGQNDYNTAFGAGALNSSNSNGTRNTAIGYLALTQYAGNTFDNNTGVGYFNMIGLTTGYGNTSIGAETMFNVGAASNNTGIGNQSLINTSGDNNVGVGARSGDGLTTGSNNTFVGTQARTNSNTGTISNSTAIGSEAIVTTSNTIQLGNSSITNVKTSGSVMASGFKTPTGTSSQYLMADGSVSSSSGSSGSSGVDLVSNQTIAGLKTFSTDIIVDGLTVGSGSGTSANTAFGYQALYSNTGGDNNTAIGNSALQSNTGGVRNTATGIGALKSNTSGGENTASGYYSLKFNNGNKNTATGYESLLSNTSGTRNTGLGVQALRSNSTGSDNTATGNTALDGNTSGINNTANGAGALFTNNIGSRNTALGYNTGLGITLGDNNTILGANVGATPNTALAAGLSNNIILANGTGGIKAQHDGTDWTLSGITTATGFKTPTGTSSQYLMADGSVSSSSGSSGIPYIGATSAVDLGNYNLTVNGLTIGSNGTSMMGRSYSSTIIGNQATVGSGFSAAAESSVFGYKASATGPQSIAIGSEASANQTQGISIGYHSSIGTGYGFAIGSYSQSNGMYSVALGPFSQTTGNYSIALGYQANAAAENSIAIGKDANVSTNNTIQLGNSNVTDVKTSGSLTAKSIISSGRMVMSTATIEYSQLNNYDVSNVSILFVKPNSTWTNIYGLTGGVIGQIIHIYTVNNQTSNCCTGLSLWNYDSSNNDGVQKLIAPGAINIDSNKNTTLVFDGTYWRVSKLGGM